jgi:hypothetical protein
MKSRRKKMDEKQIGDVQMNDEKKPMEKEQAKNQMVAGDSAVDHPVGEQPNVDKDKRVSADDVHANKLPVDTTKVDPNRKMDRPNFPTGTTPAVPGGIAPAHPSTQPGPSPVVSPPANAGQGGNVNPSSSSLNQPPKPHVAAVPGTLPAAESLPRNPAGVGNEPPGSAPSERAFRNPNTPVDQRQLLEERVLRDEGLRDAASTDKMKILEANANAQLAKDKTIPDDMLPVSRALVAEGPNREPRRLTEMEQELKTLHDEIEADTKKYHAAGMQFSDFPADYHRKVNAYRIKFAAVSGRM